MATKRYRWQMIMKRFLTYYFVFVTILFSTYVGTIDVAAQSTTIIKTDSRDLLIGLKVDGGSNNNLAVLFHVGDCRINELIGFLDDPDPKVRKNAQIVIRYLNNPAGMDAIFSNYVERDQVDIAGQISSPLREWDYKFVESMFIGKENNFGQTSAEYLFALAVDNSPRAKILLGKLIKHAELANRNTVVTEFVKKDEFRSVFKANQIENLGSIVLENSTFLSSSSKKRASATIINLSKAQDKALIEINVNHGVLAQETYHVVVSRNGEEWRFMSIGQVAVS